VALGGDLGLNVFQDCFHFLAVMLEGITPFFSQAEQRSWYLHCKFFPDPDTFAQIVKNEGVEEEKQPHKNLCDPVLLRFPVDFLLNSFQVAGFVHGFSSKMCVSSKN
jgi:hypothetical protein